MTKYLKQILTLSCALFCLAVATPPQAAAQNIHSFSIHQEDKDHMHQENQEHIKTGVRQKPSSLFTSADNKEKPVAETNSATSTASSLSVYNPEKDKAPSEGIDIKETNFQFSEPLLVRPKTDMIVIHHVGIPDGDTSAAAIHRAHLTNGWAGIGYHYVIRKNGVIERGRPLAVVGAHAYGENYHTIGINVTGNFDKEIPTEAQMKSLTELVTSLCTIYHIEPGRATIVGHRDLNSTDCPGKNLYRQLPQLRDDVQLALFTEKLKGVHLLKLKKYETNTESVNSKASR